MEESINKIFAEAEAGTQTKISLRRRTDAMLSAAGLRRNRRGRLVKIPS